MKLTIGRHLFGWSGILAFALVVLSVAVGATSPVPMSSPNAAFSAYGELLAVQGQSISVQTTDGQVLNIQVEPRARVIVGQNRHATLADLHAGQWVRVRVLQDQAGQLSSAYVRTVPDRPSAPAQGAKTVKQTAPLARESKAAVQATSAPYICGQPGGNQPVGDWPMLGHGGAHGFYNADELRLHPPLNLAWELPGDWNISSPAVVGDIAYVGAWDGMHALDLQMGTELAWSPVALNGDNEFSSPAVVNGVIYFGTWTGDVYALDADTGAPLFGWPKNVIPAGDWAQLYSPAVAGGVVYLTADRWPAAGGSVVTVYALDAGTGILQWSTDVVTTTDWDNVTSDPVVANGMVYVGTYKYGVFALRTSDGSVAWNFPMPASAWASDINFDGYVVVQNGLVYVPFTFGAYPNSYDVLYALDASNGSVVWTYDPAWPEQFSSSVLVHGGSAYLMMEKPGDPQFAYLVELDALTGQEVGRLEQVDDGTDGGWFWLSAANGVIYTTSAGMTVRAYDLSYGGADVWSYQTLWSIEVPAAPASGRLVVVDEWPTLYVFEGAAGEGGICGGVYEDANGNGTWNLGEPGIAGVNVELSGAAALSTSTDADGTYGFTLLDIGTYTVVETDLPGYVSVAANPGSTGGTAIDANTIAGIPLPAGYSSTDNNFGDIVSAECGLEVTKTCLVEPPAAGSLLCQSGIAATTLSYTGDYIADATVVFQGKDNGSATYSNVELIPGETVLTDPGQNGWTIDGTPKLGSRTTIVITNNDTGGTYEEIIHTSCSAIYEAGAPAPLDGNTPNPPNSAKGDPSPTWFVESFIDRDGNTVAVPPPAEPSSTCEIVPVPAPGCDSGSKPSVLTMRYTGGDCSASNNTQDPRKATCTDLGALTDPAFILVTDKQNPNDSRAKVFFSGDVNVNQTFDIDASNAGQSKLKSQTYYHVFDQSGGTLLQSGTFHTSCSQPLQVGDVFGSLMLEGINGQGATGSEVTYTYTVTNAGAAPIADIFLVDDKLGPIAGPFNLAGGQSEIFQALAEILDTTTNVATATGLVDDKQCTADASATVTVVVPPEEVEFCEYNLDVNIGDTFNIRDYVHVKESDQPVDWSQVFFTYTEVGANDPTTPEDWHLAEFNAGDPVTVVAGDALPGTGNHGDGEYRVYVYRNGLTTYDDHMTIRVSNEHDSEVETAKCSTSRQEDGGACDASSVNLKFKDKEVKWKIKNTGSGKITIDSIFINWPGSPNGKLREVKLGKKKIFDQDQDSPPATINSGWKGSTKDRQIDHKKEKELKFKFQHDVSTDVADYSIRVVFAEGCELEFTPGSASFTCQKPIDELTMIWNGAVEPIGVKAWKDNPDEDLLAVFDNVHKGQAVVVSGYAPKRGNDVIWEIFDTNSAGALIGESTFHLSCSDQDMNGPEDCGKPQGDGKGRSGYMNDWILEGMVDNQSRLTCSAP